MLVVAAALVLLAATSRPAAAEIELTAGGGGALTISNSKEASAILSLAGMRPGESVQGTVTIGNTGTVAGDLSLSTSNLVDLPGAGGGALSGELDLVVADVTDAASPVTVYTGKVAALTPAALGTLAAGDSRTYEFRVLFPDAGPGAENAYQGSSMSVQFDWTATNDDSDVDPPETTITSAPEGLVASGEASFSFAASEAGSTFECSLDGGPFSPCTSPATSTGLADGDHSFEVLAIDAAGNADASPAQHAWSVDATPPAATLDDPGAYLRGTVALTSTTSDAGSGVASVSYQRSPAGAGSWKAIPASWDTTRVPDGLYDLRVVVTDAAGNSTTSAIGDRRVDNTKPSLVSSSPADGATVTSAGSFQLAANEDVADIVNATLDGAPAPVPAVAGPTITYETAFANGAHTLAGELEDLAGNRRHVRVHFTVWSLAAADYPYVEKNSPSGSAAALRSTSDTATVTVPAGAWSGAPGGDWLVLRIDPSPSAWVGDGFETVGEFLDVTAYWALAGGSVHDFVKPVEIEVDNSAAQVVPATLVGGSWRAIRVVPGTTLPSGWHDGFVRDGSSIRILTRHLSFFTLLRDVEAPSVPGDFKGTAKSGRYRLSWTAASDNSGLVSAYRVYANGRVVKTVGASARSAPIGTLRTSDARGFQIAAVDEAGNVGAKSVTLKMIPQVEGLELISAESALTRRGFEVGKVSYRRSSEVAAGKVTAAGASGLREKGTKISLVVSMGAAISPPTGDSDSAAGTGGTFDTVPPAPGPYTYPASTPTDPASGVAPETPPSGSPAQAGERDPVQPHQRASEEPSDLRRFLGYALLLALAVGLGAVLHVHRARATAAAAVVAGTEPIVLWDVRLVRLVTDTVRRLARRP